MSDDRNTETDEEARARYESEYRDLLRTGKSSAERASDLMNDLEDLWLDLAPHKTPDDFTAEVHEPFDRDVFDLEELEAEYSALTTDAGARELGTWPLIENPLLIAYGYAYQSRLASDIGNSNNDADSDRMAWNYTARSSFWCGVTVGLARMHAVAILPTVSEIARGAAYVRNAENRKILKDAFDWLDENFDARCKSMDHAGELLTKVVPVAFRTARRYVTKWNASRPSSRSL